MKNIVLEYLKESMNYVSGEDMSRELGVSRTAIWKNIKKLKELGYNIESSSKKGYRLLESPDILTEGEIAPLLNTNYIGREIVYYEEIGSTNDEATLLAKKGAKEGLVVLSSFQTKGRGRLQRNWVSSKGEAIAMSILLRPEIPPFMAPGITQVVALSVAAGLHLSTDLKFSIKWPNDIILNGKKVCGILTEMDGEIDSLNYIIVGIGINVNQAEIPDEISHKATSLKVELSKHIERKIIVSNILNEFEKNYKVFKEDGIAPFIGELKKYSALIGKDVLISNPFKTFNGKVVDIDSEGYLVVEDEDGNLQSIVGGDISIRGCNSYLP
ncbi:biotin--[acetyl-CoA-carboxylase] ligase [Clostridium cylindrosporum]|uniref:Bifunctional ligase/repressor BirA n=1 Tax=Clostridium cylindrosporum DSM 605 TaxID=1121307 RepID=A0A0J8DCR3_CLOCY|nr:biotin--[acetyl-CoA-carboxylase] ligase [Clostridium cylindrosporum]KMT22038.1 bifunctional ligase/repressor BirA [Clostridium cylindrosporum DSM 605]